MKTPADIITRLQLMSQDGTKSDRRLAGLVLSDLDFASKAAISEIAARVGVSEPTVTRFCRNLGCEGLRDFKFYLAQAIAIGAQYLSPEPLNRDVREQRIASAITEAAISAMQRASENLDMKTLVGVAARIASSGNVLCIGSGGISSMMATEMQNRLFRLGIVGAGAGRRPAAAHVCGRRRRRRPLWSPFRCRATPVRSSRPCRWPQQYGAATVAITAPDSALSKAADTVIHFQPLEDGNIYKPTSSRYALMAIVDMIATSVAETRGPKVLENLRRIKQSVNTLKVDDPRLPLGD